jgi:antitoxin component YwqK of YwqJK toxin-antitoxin module
MCEFSHSVESDKLDKTYNMKKNLTAIFFLATCTTAIGQKLVGTYFDWNKIHPHEQYYVNSAGQKNGLYKEYDQGGVVLKECNYLNGVENGSCTEYIALAGNQRSVLKVANFRNGQLDGPFVWYCRYNNLKAKVSEGSFKKDLRTGLWKYWNCTEGQPGTLTTVGTFIDGKKTGLWTNYYNNGKLQSLGQMSNDKETGEWKYYSEEGTLDRRGSFDKDGKITGSWSYFLPNDSLKPVYLGNWSAGARDGEWILYYDKDWNEVRDKKLAAFYEKTTYASGVPVDGFMTYYFATGEKFSQVPMRKKQNDQSDEILLKKEGMYTQFFKNGKVETEGYYADERKLGTWKIYYESGAVASEVEYKDDNPVKEGKDYYESGKIKTITTYQFGHQISRADFDENGVQR